jgi:hypothetical protein
MDLTSNLLKNRPPVPCGPRGYTPSGNDIWDVKRYRERAPEPGNGIEVERIEQDRACVLLEDPPKPLELDIVTLVKAPKKRLPTGVCLERCGDFGLHGPSCNKSIDHGWTIGAGVIVEACGAEVVVETCGAEVLAVDSDAGIGKVGGGSSVVSIRPAITAPVTDTTRDRRTVMTVCR